VQNKNNDEIVFDVQFKSPGLGVGNTIGLNMGIPSNATGIDNLLAGGSQGSIRANPYHQFYYEEADSIRMQWTNARILIDAATGSYSKVSAVSNNPPVSAAKFRRYPVRSPGFALQTNDYDVNWPIFRYAEVLLIFAEASNEIDGPTQEAIDVLNMLRSRARNTNIGGIHRDILPRSLNPQISAGLIDLDLSNPLVSDQTAFRNYILLERSRELSQEGKRWFDLVRWGILKNTLRGLNAKYVAKISETPPVEVPVITTNKWANYWNGRVEEWDLLTGTLQDFHMLLPIPNGERLANPSIGPNNPGYN